jgi:drug/metabolite transporter (DMT)-like permease
MRQDVHVISDDDALMVTVKSSIDENNLQNIDPLIQPLIDTDELENINQNLNNLEEKSPSILTQQKSAFSQGIRRCTGIFYALIGSLLFTSSGFIIKQLNIDFFDALLCRFIIQTFILTIFIFYQRYQIIRGSLNLILLQIIRVILASSGLLLFYSSYRYIPLPDLTTVRYTQVIWTAIIAMIIFHERISIPTIFAIILTIIGVICVAQPTFLFHKLENGNSTIINVNIQSDKSFRFLGLCLAFGCALSISGSIVLNKKLLVLKIPQSILMFHFSFINLLILSINQIRNRLILHMYSNQTMFTWQYLIAASISLLQLFSSILTQKAIKLEHPSLISVVQSSDILFSIFLQNLFTNEKSNWLVLLGSALVTTSIFLVGSYKLWNDHKKSSSKETNNSK